MAGIGLPDGAGNGAAHVLRFSPGQRPRQTPAAARSREHSTTDQRAQRTADGPCANVNTRRCLGNITLHYAE